MVKVLSERVSWHSLFIGANSHICRRRLRRWRISRDAMSIAFSVPTGFVRILLAHWPAWDQRWAVGCAASPGDCLSSGPGFYASDDPEKGNGALPCALDRRPYLRLSPRSTGLRMSCILMKEKEKCTRLSFHLELAQPALFRLSFCPYSARRYRGPPARGKK